MKFTGKPSLRTVLTESTFLCIISLILSQMCYADEPLNVSGHIVTRKGITITFTKVSESSKVMQFKYGPEDKQTTIPLSDIRTITLGEDSKTALIGLADGRRIHAKCNDMARDKSPLWGVRDGYGFYFYYFDDVARKEEYRSERFLDISRIVLGENVGRFRRCPHCKSTWPDSFLFCPHDGVLNVWGEPTGSLAVVPSVTEAERTQRRSNVMEAILNASLARSGVDPTSSEAKKAKEFGKIWMNPLADTKEIHRMLDELRKDFKNKKN